MTTQLDLFGGVKLAEPKPKLEPATTVRLGHRDAQISLRKQRRETAKRLMELLEELEGKDIYIGSYDAGGKHFWLGNLLLRRLQLEYFPFKLKDDTNYVPSAIALWGNRSASVRIFTDYLVAIREQEYQGYWQYLLDFRNGFYDSKLDEFKSHYACLHIARFKD